MWKISEISRKLKDWIKERIRDIERLETTDQMTGLYKHVIESEHKPDWLKSESIGS